MCSPKNRRLFLCKSVIVTLVFETNANFFDENGRKSQKFDP
jgi:hypothetical protein